MDYGAKAVKKIEANNYDVLVTWQVLQTCSIKCRFRFDENCLSEWGTKTTEGQHSLFARLSPLLVIKLLPLRVFNDLQSSLVYGEVCDQRTSDDKRQSNIYDTECVAALILNRAFNKFEFQDVRKLAAELCGRIHPDKLQEHACIAQMISRSTYLWSTSAPYTLKKLNLPPST
ncbi:hypothetical protein RJ639_032846 [Escallonia herrerae]|uniref:Uncharacterized protein n=1 Tax=Escallonia herrerae TaxID=1293975 RepID=A0AA89BC74_9ASTE|nr:hypothetical protein RJ639_032846 [Escallonia herrerae]